MRINIHSMRYKGSEIEYKTSVRIARKQPYLINLSAMMKTQVLAHRQKQKCHQTDLNMTNKLAPEMIGNIRFYQSMT